MMSNLSNRSAGAAFGSGIFPDGTPIVKAMLGGPMPFSACLVSADATRAIAFSCDGGLTYFTPVMDVNTAAQQVVASLAPVTHVKFTGVANDTWRVV